MTRSCVRSASLAFAILLLLAPSTTLADVLVLKNGEKVNGRFANRQLLRTDPFALKHVAIDVGTSDTPDIRTHPFQEVQYLVFEDPGGQRDVIDLWAPKSAESVNRPGIVGGSIL